MSKTGIGAVVALLILGFGLLSGQLSPSDLLGQLSGQVSGETPTSGSSTAGGAPPSAREASRMLGTLRVAPAGSMAGYSRERFVHWSDAQENGWNVSDPSCDTREAALIRDGRKVQVGDGCDVASGRWLDPYTRRTYTDPADIDIDHVVPLANAWRSGASGWSADERERYANDPEVLLSVEDNANQEKGDKGPEAWKPPNRSYYCEYARRWIWIKSDYGLSVNPSERSALKGMLARCQGG